MPQASREKQVVCAHWLTEKRQKKRQWAVAEAKKNEEVVPGEKAVIEAEIELEMGDETGDMEETKGPRTARTIILV